MSEEQRSPAGRRPAPTEWALVVAMSVLARPLRVAVVAAALAYWAVAGAWEWLAILAIGTTAAAGLQQRSGVGGRPLPPGEEPAVAALVRRVADAAGFTAPLAVRVMPVPDALTGPTPRKDGGGFTIGIGWPFARVFSERELGAVIAHELAHLMWFADRRTRALLGARATLATSLGRRVHAPRALAQPMLRATRDRAWSVEFAADAAAARVVGHDACAAALTRTGAAYETFSMLGDVWFPAMRAAGHYPVDFFDALDDALRDPYVLRRVPAMVAIAEAIDGDDSSHPSIAMRVAALPKVAGRVELGAEPVMVTAAGDIDAWCVDRLVDGPADGLVAARIADTDHPGSPFLDEEARVLARATEDVTGLASIESSVAALRDDAQWRRIADALDPSLHRLPAAARRLAQREVVAACVSNVVAARLGAAGWPDASRWVATARIAPDGSVVDVRARVDAAIDTGDIGPAQTLAAVPPVATVAP